MTAPDSQLGGDQRALRVRQLQTAAALAEELAETYRLGDDGALQAGYSRYGGKSRVLAAQSFSQADLNEAASRVPGGPSWLDPRAMGAALSGHRSVVAGLDSEFRDAVHLLSVVGRVEPDEPALAYAFDRATDDVAATLDWLMGHGFGVSRTIGGKAEPFGNVLVELTRGLTVVVTTRDRGQWTIDIGRGGATHGLHIVATAVTGTEAKPGPKRCFGNPLPDQLPDGDRWRRLVPQAIDWLESGDRTVELRRAGQSWSRAMKAYFGS
jgi:hypothetical protein